MFYTANDLDIHHWAPISISSLLQLVLPLEGLYPFDCKNTVCCVRERSPSMGLHIAWNTGGKMYLIKCDVPHLSSSNCNWRGGGEAKIGFEKVCPYNPQWVEPVSYYWKVASSIPLVCMSKCHWARYWTPNCFCCAGRQLAWQPPPCMNVCMNYCQSLWTKASAKCPKCKWCPCKHIRTETHPVT